MVQITEHVGHVDNAAVLDVAPEPVARFGAIQGAVLLGQFGSFVVTPSGGNQNERRSLARFAPFG